MNLLNYLRNARSCDCCDEGNIIDQEQIQRSDNYCIKYKEWLKLNKHQSMLKNIHEASLNAKGCSSKKDPAISFLIISKINGFSLQYDADRWEEVDFRYLFEYIATLLTEEHGFNKVLAMKEATEYSNRIETIERYKLKNQTSEVDYSDILVRLCYTNDKITSIKFCATCTKKRITSLSNLLQKLATA